MPDSDLAAKTRTSGFDIYSPVTFGERVGVGYRRRRDEQVVI
jgi:hypothetical protein